MEMQFSLAHLTALELSPPELTYVAAKAGYDFVSIRPIYMGLPGEPNYALAENKEMMQQTKRALNETGIKLLDIELARIYEGLDPKIYLPAFEVAAELGARHVLSSIWTDDRSSYIEKFDELCELAEPYGLSVELEFVPIASVTNLKGVVDVLETVKRENTGIMIDAHHFHRSGDKPEDLDQIPREWFNYFHLCDAPSHIPSNIEEMKRILREERLYVGEGGINVAEIVNHLPQIPYSIELPNIHRARKLGYEEFVKQCLQTAKEYFSRNARVTLEK
ncbi:sugar phosphate isomerase/epimerase family protein [Halalkalibacter krulwichiae]|uniref:Inosose isomerase n=1 Tax=Halalkalibacter krulwichiae TaxID=199441 RepID=A0A1X9MCY2_9BACI|nr:sugar phosphate isomerase/epimerase [Halalkalibacter krulwichiae]ARK31266.1 Inosose isomerase [Halalkalibacter krulwichiae]